MTIGKFNNELPIDVYEAGTEVTTAGQALRCGRGLGKSCNVWAWTSNSAREQLCHLWIKKVHFIFYTREGEGRLISCLVAKGLLWRKADIPDGGYNFYDQIAPCMRNFSPSSLYLTRDGLTLFRWKYWAPQSGSIRCPGDESAQIMQDSYQQASHSLHS